MTITFKRASDMTGVAVWTSAAVKMHACCPVYGRTAFVRSARITGRRARSRRSVGCNMNSPMMSQPRRGASERRLYVPAWLGIQAQYMLNVSAQRTQVG
jgi:hypothetical protein